MSHWYMKDGTPAYEVRAKNGSMRATTLRDARTLNLFPSVTTISQILASPGLERWKVRKAIDSALTLKRAEGESDDAFKTRILIDSQEQARIARETGQAMHDAVQKGLDHGLNAVPDDYLPQTVHALAALKEAFGDVTWITEESFSCADGYGGRSDLGRRGNPEKGERSFLGDLKVKDVDFDGMADSDLVYDEHFMQLAAYRHGQDYPEDTVLFNLFISSRLGVKEPCRLVIHTKEDSDRGLALFLACVKVWQIQNKFAPKW